MNIAAPDGNIEYGKRITEESIVRGAIKSKKVWDMHTVLIDTKPDLLKEIMDCVGLIYANKTNDLSMHIIFNPQNLNIRMEKKWLTERYMK